MNIFALDSEPKLAARYHLDRHCVKMILEYAQILSTVHRVLRGKKVNDIKNPGTGRLKPVYLLPGERVWWVETPEIDKKTGESVVGYKMQTNYIEYQATHINHPSTIWARSSEQNYVWLCELLNELCKEYTHRYNKSHSVEKTGLLKYLCYNIPPGLEKTKDFKLPTPAMPDVCKTDCVVESYRRYYVNEKSSMFKWKNREAPFWINHSEYKLENVYE